MIIRPLTQDDAVQHEHVASQAFVFRCETENCELPSGFMLGAFADDDKTLMADMEIEERTSFFGKNTLKCLAVGGVASKPEYRRRGAVRSIFSSLFNEEKYNNGAEISILYPFSFAYYRQFGYESAGRAVELCVPFSEFGNIPRYYDVFLYEEQDNRHFFELYNKSASRSRLAFERKDAKYFTFEPYKSMLYTYVLDDYSAYISFSIDREKDTIFVKEIEYLNREALLKIIGFLRAFDSNQKYVHFSKLSENSPLLYLVSPEKYVSMRFFSTGSARILDIESVLKKAEYPSFGGKFSVRCVDSVIKNSGVFTVEYENGKAQVSRGGSSADIMLEPYAASKIFLGGIRDADALKYMNGIEILNDNKAFFDAFPFRGCFVNDEF